MCAEGLGRLFPGRTRGVGGRGGGLRRAAALAAVPDHHIVAGGAAGVAARLDGLHHIPAVDHLAPNQ